MMFRYLLAAASLALASTAASAASIDFTFDVAGSGVTLTPQGGFGSGCTGAGDCVSAGLASGFGSPLTISVEEGWDNRYTFDFLTFEGNGWGFYENYSVTATLAFTDPSEATTTSGGSGGVLAVANGYISGGWLLWNDVPTTVTLLNGSEIWIDFEDGVDLFAGNSITTSATIKVKSVAEEPAPVPLPAAAMLLMGGLGSLAAFRRKA